MARGRPLGGGNPTRADVEAAELLDRNEATRLELVRCRAEKWTGGLTALTGLIGIVLVGRTPQSLRDIETTWRIVVGVLLAIALGTLVFATYRAYQSAYGDPGRLNEVARQSVTGLAERLTTARRQATNAAHDHLRQATIATLAGVALLAVATGITWYAPDGTSSRAQTLCLMVNGKPVAELTGGTVRSTQTGTTIGPCP